MGGIGALPGVGGGGMVVVRPVVLSGFGDVLMSWSWEGGESLRAFSLLLYGAVGVVLCCDWWSGVVGDPIPLSERF